MFTALEAGDSLPSAASVARFPHTDVRFPDSSLSVSRGGEAPTASRERETRLVGCPYSWDYEDGMKRRVSCRSLRLPCLPGQRALRAPALTSYSRS